MKRIVSLFLCMALALGSVTYKPPQAKAVVLETTSAVALIGIFLTAMGLYWAYDNYQSAVAGAPVTKFGSNLAEELDEYIYEKTGEHRNVIDVMFHGDPDMGPNFGDDMAALVGTVVTVSSAAVASISAFGKWLYDKYALADNDSAVVSFENGYITLADGTRFYLSSWGTGQTEPTIGSKIYPGDKITFTDGSYISLGSSFRYSIEIYDATKGEITYNYSLASNDTYLFIYYSASRKAYTLAQFDGNGGNFYVQTSLAPYLTSFSPDGSGYSLSVSAPNGLNLPDTDALPEGQGFALEFPDIIADDFPSLLEQAVPQVLTNPEYVPTLAPTEIPSVDPNPNPTPDGEEVPDPAPAGATIIDYLVDIWRKIKALPETIPNGIKKAFEPDPELVTEITTTFTDKFGWLETIHQLGLDLCGLKPGSEPPVIFIHLEDATGKYTYGGTEKALDMSWYEPYKEDVDNIISGFMWLAFLWLVFKRAADIINGAGMVSDYEFYGSHPIDQPRLEEHKK